MTKARDLANFVSAGNPLADGTIDPADINGVTATAAELNILDGATVTTAELNILDGVTATTAEINFIDGVTSAIQTQLNGKLTASNNLSDVTNTSTARTNLGVAVGTDVLAYDSNLQSFVNTFTLPTTDGTADQVLKTDGSGAISFADAGGGAWELISSSSLFGSTTFVDISLPSGYTAYKLYLRALDPAGNNKLQARLIHTSMVSPDFYSNCSYQFTNFYSGTNTRGAEIDTTGTALITQVDVYGSDAKGGAWGEILILRPTAENTQYPYLYAEIGAARSATPDTMGTMEFTHANFYGTHTIVQEMVGIRLAFEGGGFTNGSYFLVGLTG